MRVILVKNCSCCEPFSSTGAELGGHEYGYGLAAEVENALFGEPGEGAGEGLARDARRLGHLLPAERRCEDDAPLGYAALLCGEVQEHPRHPLRCAAEDQVADEVLQLAGPRRQRPGEPYGPVGEAA